MTQTILSTEALQKLEASAPVKSVVVSTTTRCSNSSRATAAYWRRLNAAVAAAYDLPEFNPQPAPKKTSGRCAGSWERLVEGRCTTCGQHVEATYNGRAKNHR